MLFYIAIGLMILALVVIIIALILLRPL